MGDAPPRPTAAEILRGKELLTQTVAVAFLDARGAVAMLATEPEGAIRAMFVETMPPIFRPEAEAIASLVPVTGLATLVAAFGHGFHQGYALAGQHIASGAPNLHATMRAKAQAAQAPTPPAPGLPPRA